MAKQLPCIDASCRDFIDRQRIFFAASAAPGVRINLSPRGADAFAILDDKTVAYLDRTGSGNETAAPLNADGRLTLMFCAFDGSPNILRLYGRGEVLRRGSEAYRDILASAFCGQEPAGARQIVWLHVERVQTSCGYGTPLFDHRVERASTTGPAPKARRGSKPIAARRTPSASTACPPDYSTAGEPLGVGESLRLQS